jgi:hypothetical protein
MLSIYVLYSVSETCKCDAQCTISICAIHNSDNKAIYTSSKTLEEYKQETKGETLETVARATLNSIGEGFEEARHLCTNRNRNILKDGHLSVAALIL